MTRRTVANPLALAVLAYLTQRPMHPYELSRTLRDNGDERSIKFNHGSLYMVFTQLTKAGFVEPQETSRHGQRPERTVYRLTDAGRAELRDWLRALLAVPQQEYPSFLTALSLVAALPPDEVATLLDQRLEALDERLADTRELIERTVADGVAPLFLVEEEYRIAVTEAERSFVADLVSRITEPGAEFVAAWRDFHRERT